MPTGIDITARHRANIIFEDPASAGTYNPNGAQVLATDFKGDFQEKVDRGKHRNEGDNAKAYVHNKKRWVELNGDFDPCFRGLEKWLKMGFQIQSDEVLTTGSNIGGRRIVAILPNEGAIDRKTATIEWGKRAKATRSTLGLLTSLSIKNDANADCSGSLAIKARKPSARGVAMTGSVAQSAVLRFDAANVSTPGVFAIKVGTGASQNVSLAVGDTTGQSVTKLGSVGVTATVVGTVVAGSGEAHRIYGAAVTGSAVFYGGAITLNPNTSTPSSLQSAIQALGSSFAARTVAGTITAPGVTSFVVAGAVSNTALNGTYTPNGAYNSAPQFSNGNGIKAYWYNGAYYFGTTPGSNSFYSTTGTSSGPTGTSVTFGGGGETVTATYTNGPGFVDITINVPSAAGNVTDIEAVPGTGYTGTSTQPGGAGGSITATVTAPTNTPIYVTLVSGAGWNYTAQQAGSTGTPTKLAPAPIGPRMWRAWRTATLPDVATDPDVAYKLGTLLDHEINFTDIVSEVDFEDDDDSFQSWHDGVDATDGMKVGAKCTLATADSGAVYAMVQEANEPVDAFGDADNVTGANWYRFRAKRGRFRVAFDLYACVEDSTEYKDASGVYAIGFPLGTLANDAAGFFARIILELPPAS